VFIEAHPRPPGSPSNCSKVFPSQAATFSPTLRPHKSFSYNTYGRPRKCCKQKTYSPAKPFRCNTYKKQGAILQAKYSSLPALAPPRVLSVSGSFQLPSLLATTLKVFLFIFLPTLLHSRKSQLFYFQAIPHSLPRITRGGGIRYPSTRPYFHSSSPEA
jgi:hypothetical protein